jgi:hypothetical protein
LETNDGSESEVDDEIVAPHPVAALVPIGATATGAIGSMAPVAPVI